ncbi:MAD2L1-binding protein [Harpegnathos saltator]|uniref:MAD2L1-binding protein n=2 Tax=Harpegnathos saltator TaxID=610380 RepID=E2BEH8_HARSA|nr:MAD2L1-binding protein [Harpegnathos saltator]
MFSRNKKVETDIDVLLDEPLTSESCTKVVIELIKYILYQKQQIPFAYEALAQFQKSMKATDRNTVPFKTLTNTLKSVSDNLFSQFFLKGCDMQEIAILIGATLSSPKLCIRIELPSYVLNSKQHEEYQHSSRKPLVKLMRSMLECDEFQTAMSIPISATNTFIMLKKKDSNPISDFFIPKPQYVIPTQTTSFNIRLCQSNQVNIQCTCRNLVKVHHDSYTLHAAEDYNEDNVQYIQHDSSTQSSYHWHQSKQIIKGFKYHL